MSQVRVTGDLPSGTEGGTRFMKWFLVVLAISSVVTFGVGWIVVDRARASAHETDVRIRTLSWAALSYAAAFDGSFPTSEAQLRAWGTGPESIAIAPTDPTLGTWPTRQVDALHGETPRSLDDALHSIIVAWGTSSAMPPFLKPDGLPTQLGTSDEVNGWLYAFGHRGSVAR